MNGNPLLGENPPGATPLDADELDGLIPAHITTRDELNAWEQENILRAIGRLRARRPILATTQRFWNSRNGNKGEAMPLTIALPSRSSLARVSALLACLALSACAFNVNNRDPSTDPPPMFDHWPGEPPAGMAQLLVVNPYIKDCCGASAGYIVHIAGEGVDHEYDDLMPTEDFFCANVPPGDYRVTLAFQTSSYAPASELAISVATGDMRFLAADVDLRRNSYALELRETDETSALRYVNRTMHYIGKPRSYRAGHEPVDTEKIRAMNDARRQRQLQCLNLPE